MLQIHNARLFKSYGMILPMICRILSSSPLAQNHLCISYLLQTVRYSHSRGTCAPARVAASGNSTQALSSLQQLWESHLWFSFQSSQVSVLVSPPQLLLLLQAVHGEVQVCFPGIFRNSMSRSPKRGGKVSAFWYLRSAVFGKGYWRQKWGTKRILGFFFFFFFPEVTTDAGCIM